MNSFIEFITVNYAWFLFGTIIILLAVIGYYADKTNFGQKDNSDMIETNKDELNNIKENESIKKEIPEVQEESKKEVLDTSSIEKNTTNMNPIEDQLEPENNTPEKNNSIKKSFEETYEKLDKELDELLPDKSVISGDVGDLINDIDSLSLDKTQRINLSDIPDLDDVDLPEIKNIKKYSDDIWKF